MKKNRTACIVLMLFFVSIFTCFGIFLLLWGNSYMTCFGTPFPSYAQLEQSAYFAFPPSATSIEFDANGVNRKAGCTIWVEFEMSSEDLNTFAKTTAVHELSSSMRLSGDAFQYLSSKQGWSQSEDSLAGMGELSFLEIQWVFIDTTEPETWVVYLIVNKEWL